MLGSLILYLYSMRIMMFQLSGFYCRVVVFCCFLRALFRLHVQQEFLTRVVGLGLRVQCLKVRIFQGVLNWVL